MDKINSENFKRNERLKSLDILRGFDMFWIIGGGSLIISLSKIKNLSWLEPVADQMRHIEWEGFAFWDLIFPLFMFISGVTIPYAIISKAEKGVHKRPLQIRILKRALILFFLGILYNGTLQNGFSDIRFASVLGQIGIAYFIGATIVLQSGSVKSQMLWLIVIILFISALQLFVPVPGYGAGHFDPERVMNAWVDQHFLPGKLSSTTYDRLGILSVISASFLVLIGSFAGRVLRSSIFSQLKKTGILAGVGVILVIIALIFSPVYPISKVLWTMTFNFLTAGISFIMLALFYYLIDVRKNKGKIWSRIGFFFKVIGLNSITIYMAVRIIPFREISEFFTGWLTEPLGNWILIAGAIVLEWLLLYYLYKRNIFLKV